MAEDDLIFYHDVHVAQTRARVGIEYYLGELARRDAEEATNEMIAYTKRAADMAWLTVVIAVLTVISLVTTIVAVHR